MVGRVILARRVARLEQDIRGRIGLLVALSGGVDSAVLLAICARVLRGRVIAATTISPAVAHEDVEDARRVAALLGVRHVFVPTDELSDPAYRANAGDRCYFCRREMYGCLAPVAAEFHVAHVADGLNADDVVEDRPGVRAATEYGVLHPLRDAGLTKSDIRRLARGLALPVHDKPAAPCLASRVRVGVEVTLESLRRIDRAERALRGLGYRELRVRCEADHARIEIGAPELARALHEAGRLEAAVLDAGFLSSAVDPAGYRAGGAALPLEQR